MRNLIIALAVVACVVAWNGQTAEAQLMGHDAIEWSSGGSGENIYYTWVMNKYTTHKKTDVWYRNPGGTISGNKNFDPRYRMYEMLKSGSQVLTSDDLPSVSFGGSGSHYRVDVNMGNRKSGEMNVTFNRGTKYAGFANIRNSNQVVDLSLKSGSITAVWVPGWIMPVVEFNNLASGEISSGNVHITIDKSHNMRLNTRSKTGGYRGSTPMVVRASNNPYEYHVSRNGFVRKVQNPGFKRR
jgi:hypothetical protein